MLKFLFSRIPVEPKCPKILLIDDDQDIRTVSGLVLMSSGVGEFHEAASGQAGLDVARKMKPDVILLDLKLPDMRGELVLQLLKTDPWTRDIPVILFTAAIPDRERLASLQASGVIMKPFHPGVLCDAIREAIRPRTIEPPQWPAMVRKAAAATAAPIVH